MTEVRVGRSVGERRSEPSIAIVTTEPSLPPSPRLASVSVALLLVLAPGRAPAQRPSVDRSIALAEQLAPTVTIYRDRYGIPHVWAKTDAGATFGFGYAQAEDNFPRLEENFILALGRGAEAFGEPALDGDRLNRALRIPQLARAEYARLTPRVRALLDGFAAGVNLWLARHPAAPRRLLARVEPWYPLAFIRYNYYQNGLAYGTDFRSDEVGAVERELAGASRGSNGWVVGPSRSASGRALLFINPHLPYFGPGQVYEGHVHSDEAWDFSGYTRLGFPFPYVGFNATLGWVSTDNAADLADLYRETFDRPADRLAYRYGAEYRRAVEWRDTIRVRTAGGVVPRVVTLRRTHHGPIVAVRDGSPHALRMAKLEDDGWLAQWYAMTRARNVAELRRAMTPLAVQFGNVMAADAEGHTWYMYNGAVPRRDPRHDWRAVLDGSDPTTDWRGYHRIDELPQLRDPASGWMQNCNASPFVNTDAGNPDPARFPRYMVTEGTRTNPRTEASRRILAATPRFSFESLVHAAFDLQVQEARSDGLLSRFVGSGDVADTALRRRVAPAVARLRTWDGRSDTTSVAMALFHTAGREWFLRFRSDTLGHARALAAALDTLERRYGTWEVPYGAVTRVQRLVDPQPVVAAADAPLPFRDDRPSVATPGVPGALGAVFTMHFATAPGQRREYAVHGNTYVAVVEFGPRVRAAAVHVFGASGDPASPHFFDQAPLMVRGEPRPAWFYLDEIKANLSLSYRPGER